MMVLNETSSFHDAAIKQWFLFLVRWPYQVEQKTGHHMLVTKMRGKQWCGSPGWKHFRAPSGRTVLSTAAYTSVWGTEADTSGHGAACGKQHVAGQWAFQADTQNSMCVFSSCLDSAWPLLYPGGAVSGREHQNMSTLRASGWPPISSRLSITEKSTKRCLEKFKQQLLYFS